MRPGLAALVASFMALCFALPAHAQSDRPLFDGDTVVDIRIEAPMRDLRRRAKRSTDPYPATLIVDGESLPMTLAARGKSRRTRGFCRFPPLRIRFEDKPGRESFFRGQRSLKLVTHCQDRTANRENLMQEYAAYRMLNAVTDQSLRVRLVNVTYVDTERGETETHPAFFIEDTDEAAERVGMVELDLPDITTSQLSPDGATRTALFQFMISNFDFALAAPAPGGEDCCHNMKLIGASDDVTSDIVPVPYDFDFSGLVDASYASVPSEVDARNLRDRTYRGLCRHNEALRGQIDLFLSRRGEIEAVLASVPDLRERSREDTQSFIADFFEIIADPAQVERRLIGDCR